MSDYYAFKVQHEQQARELASLAAEERLARQVIKQRRADARARARKAVRPAARPALRRLRSLWSS